MKRSYIWIFVTSFILMISITLSAQVTISKITLKPDQPTYKPGDLITAAAVAISNQNYNGVFIVGGVEGEPNPLFAKSFPRWQANTKYWCTFNWTPAKDGTYILYFEVDPGNSKGLNTRITMKVLVSGAPAPKPGGQQGQPPATEPDLIVKFTNITPSDPGKHIEGDKVKLEYEVSNIGTATTNLGATVVMTQDGVPVCSDSSPGNIAPGGKFSAFCEFLLPAAGNHMYKVIVDQPNNIPESNDSNNEDQKTLTVLGKFPGNIQPGWSGQMQPAGPQPPTVLGPAQEPDLIISNMSVVPVKIKVGDSFEIKVEIKNIGKMVTKGPVTVNLVHDGNLQMPGVTIGVLAVSQAETLSWKFTAKAHGTFKYSAFVDPMNAEKEEKETNNEKKGSYSVEAGQQGGFQPGFMPGQQGGFAESLPDFTFDNIELVPLSVKEGETQNLKMTIINKGNYPGNFQFYIDVKVNGIRECRQLTPNALFPVGGREVVNCVLPTKKAGNYKYEAIIDPENSVREKDENNNTKRGDYTVKVKAQYEMNPNFRPSFTGQQQFQIAKPDLQVTSISLDPSTPEFGQKYKIKTIVKNTGNNIAKGKKFFVALFIDKGLQEVKEMDGLNLNEEVIIEFNLPSGKGSETEGKHWATVTADYRKDIEEEDENNNSFGVGFEIFRKVTKISVTDWYFERDGKKISKFQDIYPVTLCINLKNEGNHVYNGKLESYGFENPTSPKGGYSSIASKKDVNIDVTNLAVSGQTLVKIPNIPVSYFMVPGVISQNVKLKYWINPPGGEQVTAAKTFELELPDLTVYPTHYSKTCKGDTGFVTIKGQVWSNPALTRREQNFRLAYYKAIDDDNNPLGYRRVYNYLEFEGPLMVEDFSVTLSGETGRMYSSGQSYLDVCFIVDDRNKIDEINEGNNISCYKIWWSRDKNKLCYPGEARIEQSELTH